MSKIDLTDLLEVHENNEFGLGTDGFCRNCGETQSGVEPDADGIRCEGCGGVGRKGVAGTEVLLLEVA